jgi:facilitated trehalose transporter
MAAVVGSWGYLCMGTVRGWGSPGLPSLNKTLDFDMNEDDFKWICKLKIFHLTTGNSFNFSKFTYIAAMPMCSSFFGALIISIPMQYLGRKKALIGLYFFYIFGSLILGLTYFGKHKAMLYVGRLLQGLGVGCTTPACQIYVISFIHFPNF